MDYSSYQDLHVRRLEPGKRTFHTLIPGMMFENGQPTMVYGTMGGEGQPQTQAAIATRVGFGTSTRLSEALRKDRHVTPRELRERTRAS